MKKPRLLLFVLCLCLLTGCHSPEPDDSLSLGEDGTTSTYQMPDAMKEFAENPDTEWMAGMWLRMEGCTLLRSNSSENFEVFSDPGDLIRATVTVQNGLNKAQPYDLMVFADGLPVEFSIGGNTYRSYPVKLKPEPTSIELEFPAEFSLNLGRLDFTLLFNGNPQADYHMSSYTVWIDLDEDARIPVGLQPTVDQRGGIRDSCTGGAYHAWLWNEGVVPADIDHTGPKTLSIRDGETLLLEAIASRPGLYRTVLIVDGTPVQFESNGTRYSYLDWESAGTDMLQLPVTLTDVPDAAGSIYTITTPLDTDNMALFIIASGKIQLMQNGEE